MSLDRVADYGSRCTNSLSIREYRAFESRSWRPNPQQVDRARYLIIDYRERGRPHNPSITPSRTARRLARRCFSTFGRWFLSCMGRLRAFRIILLVLVSTLNGVSDTVADDE